MQDTGRDTSSASFDDMADGRWLTYAELAKLRGIDRASAFKLALRHRWRRQKNNAGHMTVFVPSSFIDQRDASEGNGYDLSHAFETALAAIREAHAGELAALRERVDMSRALSDRLERDLAAARTATDTARSDARTAQERADALRQRESAWWGQGRWARLRAAWRGQ
jgi:hypothetical protein